MSFCAQLLGYICTGWPFCIRNAHERSGSGRAYKHSYRRIPGVRRFVVLNPSQSDSCSPDTKFLIALGRGLEVRSETWAELEGEVRAWMEQLEDSIFRNHVLVIDEDGAEADDDDFTSIPHRWRLLGFLRPVREPISIEDPRQCFGMGRANPRQTVAFILLTEIERS